MGLKAIVINTPALAEPHVIAQDYALINLAMRGGQSGILEGPPTMSAEISSGNTIRLGPGVITNSGYDAVILPSDYEDVVISNGVVGYNRIDLIVAEFRRTGDTDTHTIKVVKGTAVTSDNPSAPALTQTDILAAGTVRQLALFKVRLTGAAITSVDRVAPILPSAKNVREELNAHQAVYNVAVPPMVQKLAQTYMGHIADCNNVINGSGMITPQTKNRPPGNGYGPFHSANGSQYSIGYYRNRTSSVGAGTWSEWAPTPYGVFLPLAGGTMTGAINTGGHTVHNLPTPTGSTWATPKSYVDAEVSKAITQTKAAITLKNGFSASTDASDRAPAVVKGADGRVVLQGRAKASSPTNTIIGAVPAGMRPSKRVMGVVVANEGTTQHMVPCFVLATGDIQLQWTRQMSVITAVSFDGICYDL